MNMNYFNNNFNRNGVAEWVGTLPLVVLGPFQLYSWGWLRDLQPQALEAPASTHTQTHPQRLAHQMSGPQPAIARTHSPPEWSNAPTKQKKTWKWFQGCLGDNLSVDTTLICTNSSGGRERLLCGGGLKQHLCGGADIHHSFKIRNCGLSIGLSSGGWLPLFGLDVMPID